MFEWWCVIVGALVIALVAYNAGYSDGFRRGFKASMDIFVHGETEDDSAIVWRPEKREDGEDNGQT